MKRRAKQFGLVSAVLLLVVALFGFIRLSLNERPLTVEPVMSAPGDAGHVKFRIRKLGGGPVKLHKVVVESYQSLENEAHWIRAHSFGLLDRELDSQPVTFDVQPSENWRRWRVRIAYTPELNRLEWIRQRVAISWKRGRISQIDWRGRSWGPTTNIVSEEIRQ